MSHWTERLFKTYKSDDAPATHTAEPKRGTHDFELDSLVGELADPNPAVRRRAARAIGLLADRRGVPALIKALSDADESVRTSAGDALGHFTLDPKQQALLKAARAHG